MINDTEELSDVCKTAILIDTGSWESWTYSEIKVEAPPYFWKDDLPAAEKLRRYIIHWPGGLCAYLTLKLDPKYIQPAFIEAAHLTAKQLKPLFPRKPRGGRYA